MGQNAIYSPWEGTKGPWQCVMTKLRVLVLFWLFSFVCIFSPLWLNLLFDESFSTGKRQTGRGDKDHRVLLLSLLRTNNRNRIPRGDLSVSSGSSSCFKVSHDRCSFIADGCSDVYTALTQRRDWIQFSSCAQAPAIHSLERHLNMLKMGGCFRAVESYIWVTPTADSIECWIHPFHNPSGIPLLASQSSVLLSLIIFFQYSDLGILFVSLSSVITRVFTEDSRTHSPTVRRKGCNSRVYSSSQDYVRVPGRQAY